MIALAFITPAWLPMESRPASRRRKPGFRQPLTNYTVPGATFSNSAPITLDLQPEFSVAIRYDGDHHRTDKTQ